MPTVSVIIPTYNRSHYVCEAIDSVLAQTYQDFEIIVVDDGSTDNTIEGLEAYGDRVICLQQKNAGSAVARNRGILAARGEYVAFLDSDDIWCPEKLAKQIAVLEKDSSIGMVHCDCFRGEIMPSPVPEKGFFADLDLSTGKLFSALTHCNPVGTSTVVCRREVFAEAGVMDPTLRRSQDYDLWLRIAYVTQSYFVPEVLVHFRDHQERITKNVSHLPAFCRAAELQVYRWAFLDRKTTQNLRSTTADRYQSLSYVERKQGAYKQAYLALRQSMQYSDHPWRLWPRAIALRWFSWLFLACDYLKKG